MWHTMQFAGEERILALPQYGPERPGRRLALPKRGGLGVRFETPRLRTNLERLR